MARVQNFFINAQDVHAKQCAQPYGLCMHAGIVQTPPDSLGNEDPQDASRQQHNLNAKGTVAVMFNNDSHEARASVPTRCQRASVSAPLSGKPRLAAVLGWWF